MIKKLTYEQRIRNPYPSTNPINNHIPNQRFCVGWVNKRQMANHKKETKAEKEARVLEDNVRVLRCGLYGYVHKGKAILKSAYFEQVNLFSKWVQSGHVGFIGCISSESGIDTLIHQEAAQWQKKQPLFIPNELPNTKGERIVIGGNNYESQIKMPTF